MKPQILFCSATAESNDYQEKKISFKDAIQIWLVLTGGLSQVVTIHREYGDD